MNLQRAYAYCESVTRSRAANFFYGIRLLPPDRRRGMCAVYALARRVDDIGDGGLDDEAKLVRLASVRQSLERVSVDSDDPVLAALGDSVRRFNLPLDVFGELVDGVEMDVRGATYETFGELEAYCRRVAGSIGRLSVAVFGSTDRARASELSDDLGVAMQLTNILRDVREDLDRGRVYLPREDLDRFGCSAEDLAGSPAGAVAGLVRFEVNRAREWFGRGLQVLPLLDSRAASCVSAMTGIYRRILARVERRPQDVLQRRISLPPWEKAWVAARSLAGARA
ncbi:MAG: presqualene diphosphate synthase HpnD [Actinomycetota bacterium]|nr:presqualene diphosphate synthase HpnD [Actinomycetota bacterium]